MHHIELYFVVAMGSGCRPRPEHPSLWPEVGYEGCETLLSQYGL